jgi:hypothetical protein
VSEPVVHRAVLKHRQVLAAAMAARSRPISLSWLLALLFAGLLLAVWAGGLFSFWFVQQLPFDWMFALGPYLPTFVTALFAYFVVVLVSWVQNRVMGRAYLRNFTRLGIPLEIEALYEVLPEGLRLTTDRITLTPRWQSIDTVERVPQGWVISADQLTFLLPRESFADEATERALIAAILERLSEPALERSRAAAMFAAGEV